jgi:large subunit ribosomal protein L9
MDVILLERILKLGRIGEVVEVKDGFAKNYLLPSGKAVRASKSNHKYFEAQRASLEARDKERRSRAKTVAQQLESMIFKIDRVGLGEGRATGSIFTADVVRALKKIGVNVGRRQIEINSPISRYGTHKVVVHLHPMVSAELSIEVGEPTPIDSVSNYSKHEIEFQTDETTIVGLAKDSSDGNEDEESSMQMVVSELDVVVQQMSDVLALTSSSITQFDARLTQMESR